MEGHAVSLGTQKAVHQEGWEAGNIQWKFGKASQKVIFRSLDDIWELLKQEKERDMQSDHHGQRP